MDENFSRLNAVEAALVRALHSAALRTAEACGKELPEALSFELERPRRADQGDRASNVAMQLARAFSMPPRDIAARIAGSLQEGCQDLLDRVEVAGPGFINLFLSHRWFAEAASQVLQQGERYGAVDLGQGRRVQVEFVSANPTGPLHIGHGRGAAVGDAVARILSFTGWNVEREYYLNDAGLQIETLGRSTQARYFEVCGRSELAPLPEDGYKGDYLLDLAERIRKEEGDRFLATPLAESLPWFERYAADHILEGIREDLERFGVLFDSWFSEASLYERDLVSHAMEDLKKRGYAFESNGALWFKSTAFADDKDRVLIRSNGVPTYFASDVAYHHDKFVRRGFDRVIDVWGADHHGYVPRMKAAVEAMGRAPDDFKALLIQLVALKRDGKIVSMSTRAGEFVTLRSVLDEVGVDATRFFFLMRRSDSQLDFDLDLAKKQSSDNPVYYLQYAHARISSLLREWEGRGGDVAALRRDGTPLPDLLFDNREARALAETLATFPVEMAGASADLAPHVVTAYALNLAGAFHSFYNTNRILGESTEVERGRLRLAEAVRIVLATCLGLLGVSAPERM
ncbi:arginine--tRNA ligase [Fretibacterium fastidiosum]|uniref:Arginine--tRNA ligase n=1 Tax=Fretibacterium fastidiosum TaxID=651822 RepID=A0AB94IXJ5_9BACT|nr:arginine--tRNA ligase [Fretibacterium fastidiosum]CBL28502.1 arginyl-tRNA synthetase [Fretibacterium fastidiosum]